MQLIVAEREPAEELEPIMTATDTARSLPTSLPSSKEEEEEPRIARRLDRVAQVCAARIRQIDRSLFLLGKAVSRLARHYDRERGLTALSAHITKTYGKVVSGQRLGQARLVFETFGRDEYENRVSHLTPTHLLKVAQALPDPCDRDARNALLDRAVKENSSVAELATFIKNHKSAKATKQSPDPPPPAVEVPVVEARGYVCDDELTKLATLSDRGVGFLRIRETVSASDAIAEAGRVLAPTGLMIVELSGVAGYIDADKAVRESGRLRVMHTLIVLTSSNHRQAPSGVPVDDGFRIEVLIGGFGFHHTQSQPKRIDNPMSQAVADELVYSLVPDSGLVVDVGAGSAQTADWATTHGREYLAVEPNENVHAKKLADLDPNLSTDTCSEPTAPDPPDLWPMVSASHRERVNSGSASWNDFTCCDRTRIAIVVTGGAPMVCPVCQQKCTAKLGAVTC